jgi:electron transfer flavoprotein alpha subunit
MLLKNSLDKKNYNDIWVIAELNDNSLDPVTLELLGEAEKLAKLKNCEVWCVVLGYQTENIIEVLKRYRVNVVLNVDDPELNFFVDELYSNILSNLIKKYKPEIILAPATCKGRAYIPRVAASIETGLTADCTKLSIDNDTGNLLQTRPAFGGNLMATIVTEKHRPQMATVRPYVMEMAKEELGYKKRIINEKIDSTQKNNIKKVLEVVSDKHKRIKLIESHFIIAGGRGVRGKEGFDLLKKLAILLDGAVGATRSAVDLGWIPYEHQIGQTGLTVQSKVYIACGISGQIQHLVGIQNCNCVIAINNDREAPIMKVADIAIIGDLFEIIPAIIKKIEEKFI